MKTTLIYLIILILIFIAGYFIGGRGEDNVITQVQIDTLYIHSPPQVITKTAIVEKIRRDTLIITERDTIILKEGSEVAKTDTTFKEGALKVEYYFPPANVFRLDWQPYPQKVVTVTNNVTIEPKWYNNQYLWGVTGLLLGAIVRGN